MHSYLYINTYMYIYIYIVKYSIVDSTCLSIVHSFTFYHLYKYRFRETFLSPFWLRPILRQRERERVREKQKVTYMRCLRKYVCGHSLIKAILLFREDIKTKNNYHSVDWNENQSNTITIMIILEHIRLVEQIFFLHIH